MITSTITMNLTARTNKFILWITCICYLLQLVDSKRNKLQEMKDKEALRWHGMSVLGIV